MILNSLRPHHPLTLRLTSLETLAKWLQDILPAAATSSVSSSSSSSSTDHSVTLLLLLNSNIHECVCLTVGLWSADISLSHLVNLLLCFSYLLFHSLLASNKLTVQTAKLEQSETLILQTVNKALTDKKKVIRQTAAKMKNQWHLHKAKQA